MIEFLKANIGNLMFWSIVILFLYRDGNRQGGPSIYEREKQANKEKVKKKLTKYIFGIYIITATITYICFLLNFESINSGLTFSILNFLLGVFVTSIICALNFLFFVLIFKFIDVYIKGLGYKNVSLLVIFFFPLDEKEAFYPAILVVALNCCLTYMLWSQFIFGLI